MTHEETLVSRYLNGWDAFVPDAKTGWRMPVMFIPRGQDDSLPWVTKDNRARFPSHKVITAMPLGKVRTWQRCDTCGGQTAASIRLNPRYLPWGQCEDCLLDGLAEEVCLIENHANKTA